MTQLPWTKLRTTDLPQRWNLSLTQALTVHKQPRLVTYWRSSSLVSPSLAVLLWPCIASAQKRPSRSDNMRTDVLKPTRKNSEKNCITCLRKISSSLRPHHGQHLCSPSHRRTSFSGKLQRLGYYQVPMAAADKEKTSFVTEFGKFQFKVMPFGLKNAPSTFQRMMDTILEDTHSFARCYLDDICVQCRIEGAPISPKGSTSQIVRCRPYNQPGQVQVWNQDCGIPGPHHQWRSNYTASSESKGNPGLPHPEVTSEAS